VRFLFRELVMFIMIKTLKNRGKVHEYFIFSTTGSRSFLESVDWSRLWGSLYLHCTTVFKSVLNNKNTTVFFIKISKQTHNKIRNKVSVHKAYFWKQRSYTSRASIYSLWWNIHHNAEAVTFRLWEKKHQNMRRMNSTVHIIQSELWKNSDS